MKYAVSASEKGLVFLNEKGKALEGDFAFIDPLDNEHSIGALKSEVNARGNVTRAALSCIVQILNTARMDGYKGQGNINADDARIDKNAKTALRDAESAFFAPMFKDTKKLDGFLSGIRDAGIYATVKGVALKYFYFLGKLPCHYVGDNPDTGKLLSVSAMQKLLSNAQAEKPVKDESIAARLGTLLSEFVEDDSIDEAGMQIILARLGVFTQEVKEALNSIAAHKTESTANMLPVNSGAAEDPFVAACADAWNTLENVQAQETEEQE